MGLSVAQGNLPATLGRIMICRLLGIGLLSAAMAVSAQQAAPVATAGSLQEQVAAITAEPAVSRAHWGVSVTKLDGTPVFALNDAQFFQPASNAKLFTTSAAMALLGPDRTFETGVYAQGKRISPSSLEGDLILRGGGDPNISGTVLPYVSPAARLPTDPPAPPAPKPDPLRYLAELADKVAATGLKHVSGSVIGDDSLYFYEPYPEDWTIDDSVWGYGAPISALTINDNQILLTMKPGAKSGAPISYEISPAMPWYNFDTSDAKTGAAGSGSHLDVQRIAGTRVVRIFGTIAPDAPADREEIAIDDPAEYAAKAFKLLLADRGVTVAGDVGVQHRLPETAVSFTTEARKPVPVLAQGAVAQHRTRFLNEKPLVTHTSVPLGVDVVLTNKISQNLHAELLLHAMSAAFIDGSTVGGARVVRSWLTQQVKVDPDDFVFFDGSGLSGHDLVTPRAIAKLLSFAATQPWGAAWKASLPIGGEDGSLRARFPKAPLKDHVYAKTGTLGEARALSGYLDCASGQTLIFSVMVNAHMPRTSDDMKAMDRIVAAIAATN
jgi:D-alanyl-D-alanine carboxypeptidase/D-alanyl-D-alanine-endopeptidase (penicillin-binding protein 4)